MELRTRDGHLKDRSTRTKPEYRNRARFFSSEERRPAQGPSQGITPKGPSQRFYTRLGESSPPKGPQPRVHPKKTR
ncbi:hypothetical protein V1478_014259 [Vespula squamosa]|uniref:Uncharacterized protein n=1 Tax=Vespula squamosa TaxID=30214 RepID=A0ABD2A7H7_VESSQ